MSDGKSDVQQHVEQSLNEIRRDRYAEGLKFLLENDAVADFDYWAKVPSWSIPDTALLINGVDPTRAQLNRDSLIQEGKQFVQFKDYENALRILNRAATSGEIPINGHPLSMLKEVLRRGITYRIELADTVLAESKRIREFDMQLAKSEEEENGKVKRANEAAEVAERNADSKLQAGEEKLGNLYLTMGLVLSRCKDKGISQASLIRWIHDQFSAEEWEKLAKSGQKKSTLESVFKDANDRLECIREELSEYR
jgi:hypothetical protein